MVLSLLLVTVWAEIAFWIRIWQYILQFKIYFSFDPAIQFLEIYSTDSALNMEG